MAYLGKVKGNCQADTPYTGLGNCPKKEGPTSALIITGANAFYPMDSDGFISGLAAHVTETGTLRMYPIKGVVGMTVSGGDINAPDLGTYGGPAPSNLNVRNIAYQIDGGDCLYKELSKFNRRKMRIFRVDDEGFVYGTVVIRNGVEYFAGFEVTLYATKTPADGSANYNLSLWAYYTMQNESEEKNLAAFEAGIPNIPDGLVGIILEAGATAGTASVVTVCGGDDVTAEWSDRWSEDTIIASDGTAPTSVAFNEETGLLTIAPAGSYRVASASVLAEAEIEGLDGVMKYTTIAA